MSILFFLRDKQRLKLFLKILAIAIPILVVTIVIVNYYENKNSALGTANNEGGVDYQYSGNGVEKLPDPFMKILPKYPNGTVTYYNLTTNAQRKLSGNVYTFTQDDFINVKKFYKPMGKVIQEDDARLEIDKNGADIVIEKENIKEDDPIKNQTKFSIFMPE